MKENLKTYIDKDYKAFHERLVFTKYEILGIRSQVLKDYAKNLQKENKFDEFFQNFLKDKKFYEYLQIIAYGINYEKDFQKALEYTKKYLDFVDNWANCDTLAPKSFKNKDLKPLANELLDTNHTYKIRFAILCFMKFISFKDGIKAVFDIKSNEYYINMARAWYFQVLLAKEFELGISFLKSHNLDKNTLKLTIQKCKDSYRISKENKELISSLRFN